MAATVIRSGSGMRAHCGEAIHGTARALCDTCLSESRRVTLVAFERAGPAAIAAARAAGQDPSHGGRAASARGATQSVRRRDELAWQGAPPDPAAFYRDVLPTIASVPLGILRERTGLSIRYVSLIRRGLRVPHRRWWSALAGEDREPSSGAAPTFVYGGPSGVNTVMDAVLR
jgi:hypothetical protein